MLRLIVHVPNGENRRFKFSGWRTVLGRSSSCELTLVSAQVSKTHAAIEIIDNVVTIRDLGSRNGVLVNGTRVAQQRDLYPGDVITLGDVSVTVDPNSPVFHDAHTPSIRIKELLQSEQDVQETGEIDFAEPATESIETSTMLICRPVVSRSGSKPFVRALRVTEDFVPRTTFRLEAFRGQLSSGEQVWVEPRHEIAEIDSAEFVQLDDVWFEEPEDHIRVQNGSAILLRHYYVLPNIIRIFSARDAGFADDGLRVFSERSSIEPLRILTADSE